GKSTLGPAHIILPVKSAYRTCGSPCHSGDCAWITVYPETQLSVCGNYGVLATPFLAARPHRICGLEVPPDRVFSHTSVSSFSTSLLSNRPLAVKVVWHTGGLARLALNTRRYSAAERS